MKRAKKKQASWGIHVVALAAAAVLIGFVGVNIHEILRAQTVHTVTACQTINQSGTYVLQNNITVTNNNTCFIIQASDVIFDGNGKTISSSTTVVDIDDFYGNQNAYTNVTVRNVVSDDHLRVFGDLIHDVTFEQNTVRGIDVLGSDDVTVQNNTIGNGGIHINIADRAGWYVYRPIIQNNTISGGSTDVKILLEINGGRSHPCPQTNAVVTNNTITNVRNDPPPEATASVRFICAAGTRFQNNSIHGTGTTIGLYMRDEADNGLITNNTFWTNAEEAIRIASGNVDKTFPSNNIFRDNIFRSDTGPTLFFQGMGKNNVFQNNIFWGHGGDWSFIGGAGGNVWDHNTFYITGAERFTTLGYRSGPPNDTWTNNIFDYNNSSVFGYDGWGNLRYSGDYNLFHNRGGVAGFGGFGATLAAWRTTTGSDAHSIEGSPMFMDTVNGNFHLQAGSPAIGSGSNGSDIGAQPFTVPACEETWAYDPWSSCTNHIQTRTASDENACGTTAYRLPLSRSCDTTAPSVGITGPTSGGTVNGTTSVTATATDDLQVRGVQFQLDGADLGGEDITSPYSVPWDTTLVADGVHTLTAIARDPSDNSTTSTSVSVTTNNGIICLEDWESTPCSPWSSCVNGTQTRTCTDANDCGTISHRPALTQSCSVNALSCGVACQGCAGNNILATACSTPRRGCDGTNSIEDVRISRTSAPLGTTMTVEIDYSCFAANPPEDNVSLWYHNGTSWNLIEHWPAGLTGCDQTSDGVDGTVTTSFTVNGAAGNQYVRAILAAGSQVSDPLSNSSSCPDIRWGNIDDMAFTATAISCIEDWDSVPCSAWSSCVNGSQSRTCTDSNQCGTTNDQPALTQACVVDVTAPNKIQDLRGS